jgi:hypothetical protein
MNRQAKGCGLRHSLVPVIALAVAALSSGSFAATASKVPIVVELFTSEGCSSCPPADALLRYLDNKQPVDGVQLIVMEEHVDYWDDEKWRDPFSSHEFTMRQTEYTQRLHVPEPYTPEMVVDGVYEFNGNDRARVAEGIEKADALPLTPVRIASLKVQNGKVSANIETDALAEKADVFVALAIDHAESQVEGGENAGHRLEHVAIVKSLTRLGKVNKGDSFSKGVSFRLHSLSQAARLIAFVQEPGQRKILGAAMEHFQP